MARNRVPILAPRSLSDVPLFSAVSAALSIRVISPYSDLTEEQHRTLSPANGNGGTSNEQTVAVLSCAAQKVPVTLVGDFILFYWEERGKCCATVKSTTQRYKIRRAVGELQAC